jgi:trk system potassium uptake protein TrkA
VKIIIAGAGEVGFHLAKLLSSESQDIVLIDNGQKVLGRAQSELDVFVIKGNATSLKVLEEAEVSQADLLIAVTSSETTNISVATIGKQLGAKKTIARVNNPEFLQAGGKIDFERLGIDVLISPEELAAKEISRLVRRSAFTDAFEFEFGKLLLLGLNLENQAPILGKECCNLTEVDHDKNFITIAIQRKNQTFMPEKGMTFELGDHAYFVVKPEGVDDVMALAGKQTHQIKDVMILGGGKVGMNTIAKIQKRRRIKVIEKSAERCFEIADTMPDVLVINEDGHNVKLLEQENIDEMDAFIAVTGNSETNIMSCLVAKSHGVKKTIALVENMDYINLSQTLGIDTLINKKLIAANNIFRHVRQGVVINIAGLHGVEGEILEFEVHKDSLVSRKPLNELKFPNGAMIGGFVRRREGIIVQGDEQLVSGDRVVVFAKTSAVKDVEKFF